MLQPTRGTILSVNPVMEKLFGSHDEMTGEYCDHHTGPIEANTRVIWKITVGPDMVRVVGRPYLSGSHGIDWVGK